MTLPAVPDQALLRQLYLVRGKSPGSAASLHIIDGRRSRRALRTACFRQATDLPVAPNRTYVPILGASL